MIRKYVLPIIAVLGLFVAIYVVQAGSKPVPIVQPVAQPAAAPYQSYIAGAGLIEASTENIAIGTNLPGIVTDVLVQVNDPIDIGQKLFQVDDATAQAQLKQAQAAVTLAQAKLTRLENSPRPEEIPAVEARLAEAEAALAETEKQLKLWDEVEKKDARAVSAEQLIGRRAAVQTFKAKRDAAKADLALLKAGAWKPDKEIAAADLASASAQRDVMQTNLNQLTVRSPIKGRVLQVKVRKGEYAQAGPLATPLMVVGDIDTLHVRVDVDENDAWRFIKGARAVAFVRGNRELHTELTFVRAEPYVVPKRSLTGESTERVDTRVLQVLYSFKQSALRVYVGQQMDVFIEAPPVGGTSQPASQPKK